MKKKEEDWQRWRSELAVLGKRGDSGPLPRWMDEADSEVLGLRSSFDMRARRVYVRIAKTPPRKSQETTFGDGAK
jgi:hypothetical protein